MTAVTAPRWDLLADIVHARRASLGLTLRAVAQSGGPASGLLARIESGHWKPSRGVLPTLAKLDTGLRWESGSAAHVLAGHPPRELIPKRPVNHHASTLTAIENELDAIRVLARSLDALPGAARDRVLAWADARYGTDHDQAEHGAA